MQLHEDDTKLFKVKFTNFNVWQRAEGACQLRGTLDFGVAPDFGGAFGATSTLVHRGLQESVQFCPQSLRDRLWRDGWSHSFIRSLSESRKMTTVFTLKKLTVLGAGEENQ